MKIELRFDKIAIGNGRKRKRKKVSWKFSIFKKIVFPETNFRIQHR